MATTTGSGPAGRRRENPYSRGFVTNLKDFFFDGTPWVTRRENGMAMLGGQRVDYTRLYDLPSRSVGRPVRGEGMEAVPLREGGGEEV